MHELTTSGWAMHYLTRSAVTLVLMGAVAWAGDRWLRRLGPVAQHRLWLAALLMSVLLPLTPSAWLTGLPAGAGIGDGGAGTIAYGVVTASGRWTISPQLCAAVSAIYLLSVLFALTRLMWRWQRTCAMRRCSTAMALDERAAQLLEDAARRAGVGVPAVRCSTETCGPVVLGTRQPVLVVPDGFFDTPDEDVFTALAHECVHIARRDYAKNLFYEFAALAVTYHPAYWLMRRRIAETREMICDELAAATGGGRAEYAASLLRLVRAMATPAAPTNQAIGVFDGNTLEERIMRLTIDMPNVSRTQKVALTTVIACALLGGGVTAAAVPFALTPQENAVAAPGPEKIYHVGDGVTPPVLTHSVDAEFTKRAKHAKYQGVDVVACVVDTDGMPREVHTVRKLDMGLDEKALEAVRQYRFKPGLLNGKPVPVAIQIEVNFRLY
ncbi:MAG: M56 family metallopeptidase [Acidobacteriaceae bacterium]